ncbi:MAG: class I SAM-dependent methyltransferase [Desmonostoc geniculatum HA4340-LM1]|jgi:hypothetical protein|nr:class I SAM-dependent methyltransferase [Desmonostoc geniculatum HA4340-LM1]
MKIEIFKKLIKLYSNAKKIKNYLEGERDILLCQVDSLLQQKEKLLQEREYLEGERNLLLCQVDSLLQQKEKLVQERENIFYKPGHFYSPIPDFEEVFQNKERIFKTNSKNIPGINLNEDNQLIFLEKLSNYFKDFPFPQEKTSQYHYYTKNSAFSFTDALILFSMLCYLQPRKVIEVGSGFSSAVIYDTNLNFLDNSIETIFIEPFPDTLAELFIQEFQKLTLYKQKLQNLSPDFFQTLTQNDILFIDSSHVCKIGSDVNHLFAEILPILESGVVIHIHDIHFPFEYPEAWVSEGRAWNESYLLRSFLQFNSEFEILFWPSFILQFHKNRWEKIVSRAFDGTGSIWLIKK